MEWANFCKRVFVRFANIALSSLKTEITKFKWFQILSPQPFSLYPNTINANFNIVRSEPAHTNWTGYLISRLQIATTCFILRTKTDHQLTSNLYPLNSYKIY